MSRPCAECTRRLRKPSIIAGLNREGRLDLVGAAIVAALIAFALAFGAQRGRRTLAVVARTGDTTALAGSAAKFQLFPTQGRIEVAAKDGRSQAEIEMSLVVDGIERPLAMRRGDVHVKDKNTLVGDFPIELGEERASGTLELRMDPASDLLTASLAIAHEAGSSDHTYALRFGLAPEGRSVFVPGNGEIGDTANIQARTVVVDDETHPFAFLSSQGPLTIVETAPDTDQAGARPRLVLSSRTETAMRRAPGTAPGKPARLDIGVLVGASSQAVWGRLYSRVSRGRSRARRSAPTSSVSTRKGTRSFAPSSIRMAASRSKRPRRRCSGSPPSKRCTRRCPCVLPRDLRGN